MVEMHIHKAGYKPPNETKTFHSRRRYRLSPLPGSDPSIPTCDPSLWIVHYVQADPNNHYPTNRIPVQPQIQQMMQQRRFFQQHGQLVRKEFMLHDRSNWPTIHFPGGQQVPQYQQAQYPNNLIQMANRNYQQSHMQDRQTAGITGQPQAKRQRSSTSSHRAAQNPIIQPPIVPAIDDEEDTSRGDLMDFLTPRDISSMRYVQHHGWMEEIFSSPYGTGQIVPVDLGLGRKGELESLTKEFFEAPLGGTPVTPNRLKGPALEKKLDEGQAEDFTKRATEKIAKLNAEMEKMKRQHAKRIAKLTKHSAIREADERLKHLNLDASATGPDPSIAQPAQNLINDSSTLTVLRQGDKLDEIGREAEAALGRRIEIVPDVKCVQKGGLEEKASLELAKIDPWSNTNRVVMPGNPPSRQTKREAYSRRNSTSSRAHASTNSTATLPGSSSKHPSSYYNSVAQAHTGGDVTMTDVVPSNPTDNQIPDPNDWVMVDKQTSETSEASGTGLLPDLPSFNPANPSTDMASASLPDFGGDGAADDAFDATDFGEGVDFGELGTAGEELAGYGDENGNVDAGDDGLDLGPEVDLGDDITGHVDVDFGGGEDSAFGDAFHHTEQEAEEQARLAHEGGGEGV